MSFISYTVYIYAQETEKVRSRIHHFKTEVLAVSLTICVITFLYLAITARDSQLKNIFEYTPNDLYIKILYFDKLSDPAFHFALGTHYFSAGADYDIEKAKKYYIRTLKIDKDFPLAHYQLAKVYLVSRDYKKALTHIDRELMYYPEFTHAYYIRGLINGYTDNLPAAAEDFKSFLERDPESGVGYNDLAWVYVRQGDYASAYQVAATGLRYSPGNPWLLSSVGIALQNMGDNNAAQKAYHDSLARFETFTPESSDTTGGDGVAGFHKTDVENMKQTVATNLDLIASSK